MEKIMKTRVPLTATCLALMLSSLADANVIVSVTPSNQTVNIGDMFTVQIMANMSQPILGWGLDFTISDESVAVLANGPAIGSSWQAVHPPDDDGLAGFAFPTPV